MLKFDIITIFPRIFDAYFGESIVGRAQRRKLVKIRVHDLRDHVHDRHKTVDDKPYGGGAGMVLKPGPIWRAVSSVTKFKPVSSGSESRLKNVDKKTRVVLLTPKGRTFSQKTARRYAKMDRIVLICGHYEGFDKRISKFVDEEISMGDYVLTGGELPAMVVVDAVSRLVPGAIRKESLQEESFSIRGENRLEYPQYTRPEEFRPKKGICWKVPKTLLSGHHGEIGEWKRRMMKEKK